MAGTLEVTIFTETVFTIGDASYLVHSTDTDMAIKPNAAKDGTLVSVFNVPRESRSSVTPDWLAEALTAFKEKDDVFQEPFLTGVVLNGVEETAVESRAREYLQQLGTQWIHYLPDTSTSSLLPGPYILLDGRLRDVWRLYNDSYGTFMATFKPQSGPFQHVPIKSSEDLYLTAAVPSRLKIESGESSVINGLRVAVKDNYHIAGVKTSVGSRAYFKTFPPQPATADSVQKLIDLGAVIVGKTKMNSLGNWEEPTEYTEYHAPWNPRADEFQSAGGSSTGSASAIAAYDWLDIALGSDTWGSIMRPALWGGCFGFRPSHGAVSGKGLEPCIDFMDMPAFLGRDLQKCIEFAEAWLDTERLRKEPMKITAIKWASDFWGYIGKDQNELAETFVKDIETHLGLKHTKVSFAEEWAKDPPPEAQGLSLEEYTVPAQNNLGYDGFHALDEFREKFREQFNAAPYVSPPNRGFWEEAKSIPLEERNEAVKRVEVFKEWFNEKIMDGKDANVLMVLPIENLLPRYRDEPPQFKRPPPGVNSLFLSPVLKTPEFVFPVGEIPYISKVTENQERLPFAVGLMTPPGTDLQLMRLTKEILDSAGRPTSVSTGPVMWPDSK